MSEANSPQVFYPCLIACYALTHRFQSACACTSELNFNL
ncbi:hypothetical protein PPHE_a1001 [Pseudoalteromonas phenolica O-BC30]|nr:hypothetical protein [Pseudoalteromonas phenolica O-BC30]